MERGNTKQRVLLAALDLFAQKGYDGVGVDSIAEAVGMKGPSLYRHFKGKEELFQALVEMVSAHYEQGFGSAQNPGKLPDTVEELVQAALARVRYTMHDEMVQKVRRVLAMEQFRSRQVAKLTSHYYLDGLQEMYAGIFAGMMEKGVLKQHDPQLLAMEFVAPVTLLIHVFDRQPQREAEVMEKMQRHFDHFISQYRV